MKRSPPSASEQSRESQAIDDDYATVEICYNELTDINEREIFVYAFRLGARIAIEVLFPNAES